ncbi:MAG: YlxR family protein [Clostridiales bacterium]|nr:YlxR family protein [Clostridiales bacterium]
MAEKYVPLRRCVGCGELKPKGELIRIIKTDEGVLIDETGKKNGRGAYLCKNVECLERARKSRGFERSLKVAVPKDVYERLCEEMSLFAE